LAADVVEAVVVALSRSLYGRSPGGEGGTEIPWSRASLCAPEVA